MKVNLSTERPAEFADVRVGTGQKLFVECGKPDALLSFKLSQTTQGHSKNNCVSYT
jgi:hypothetical protein